MLGLGLAVTVGKRILGNAIDALFSLLNGRATYYENASASKSTIKAIDNADILDKATILLTPTATSDARVHSVKTYTGDELVTNGDFSDGSNGWFVTNGNVTDKYNASMTAYQSGIKITPFNKTGTYRVTFDLVVTSGSCKFDAGGGNDEIFSTSGSKTIYVTNTLKFEFNAFNLGWVGSLDNVSVVDVSSDFDFDRASSATRINSSGLVQDMQSITDPELVLNGDFEELGSELVTNGSFDTDSDWTFSNVGGTHGWRIADGRAICDTSAATANRNLTSSLSLDGSNDYKLTLDILQSADNITVYVGGTALSTTLPTGENLGYEYYISSADHSGGVLMFYAGSSDLQEIDNVSVKQVDPNDRWTLGTGITIGDGVATFTSTPSGQSVLQSAVASSLPNGALARITFEVFSRTEGSFGLYFGGTLVGSRSSVGVFTAYFTKGTETSFYIRALGTTSGTISNISVKDITFSTDVDLARINYDGSGANGHILLEPTSTNLLTYSQEFDHSSGYWNKSNTVIENAVITSPDGSSNTYKLFANLSTTSHFTDYDSYSGASSGQTYTFSLFVKSAGSDFVQIASSSGFPARYQNFNLSTGAKASGDISNATIEAYPNGWYRISVTETTNGTSRRFLIVPALTDMARNASFAGNVEEDGVYIFGAQLEQLGYATSLIPTLTGSTVTRAAETLTGSGNSTLINSTEGVLYAEIESLVNDGTNRYITLTNGTSNERVALLLGGNNNQLRAIIFSATQSLNISFDTTLTSSLQFNKLAVRYKSGEYAFYLNGSPIGTDTNSNIFTSNTLNDLSLNVGGGSLPFYGKCKALAVFNEALSDTELQNLTS